MQTNEERGETMAMRLVAARVNAGLTQKEVCAKYNSLYGKKLAVTTLLNWEHDRSFPTVPQFKALCAIYGVNMNDIIVPDLRP